MSSEQVQQAARDRAPARKHGVEVDAWSVAAGLSEASTIRKVK